MYIAFLKWLFMRFHVTKFAWTRDTGIFSRISLFIDFLINGNR